MTSSDFTQEDLWRMYSALETLEDSLLESLDPEDRWELGKVQVLMGKIWTRIPDTDYGLVNTSDGEIRVAKTREDYVQILDEFGPEVVYSEVLGRRES